jgi:hypothetical protein
MNFASKRYSFPHHLFNNQIDVVLSNGGDYLLIFTNYSMWVQNEISAGAQIVTAIQTTISQQISVQ